MLPLETFLVFAAASWALILTPGPDMLYTMTRGMTQGRRAGMLSAAGIALGLLVHTLAASLGLAVLLKTSATAFLIVKYVGAAYLLYLGLRAFLDGEHFDPGEGTPQEAGASTIFWRGTLTNVLNPKVALFFMAFLPQFADSARGSVALQMILLGSTFIVLGVTFLLLVGYFSGRLGRWLKGKPWVAERLNGLAGVVFVGLGLRLLFLDS